MGDRWSVNEKGWVRFDDKAPVPSDITAALGMTAEEFARVTVEQRNADPRTNPPKVEMVPWAEVDTKPGMHLPAEGDRWADYRTFPDQRLYAYEGEGHSLAIYVPGDMVPVRSSNGKQA